MVDPDAPSRQNPNMREWHHWLVVNMPGTNVNSGETLTEYVGPEPPRGTGLHRYVLLAYKQPGRLTLNRRYRDRYSEDRGGFKIRRFARNHNLGQPIAGNFFQARWGEGRRRPPS